tara:strand:+ start:468 stop:746 length:279 start_codon:yes stop_codon:yes gene_type:complete
MNSLKLLRKYIRYKINEVSRNYHTINPTPITFEDFSDYEIEINSNGNGQHVVHIYFKEKKLYGPVVFKDYEEAKNNARRIIDSHRVSVMNSN